MTIQEPTAAPDRFIRLVNRAIEEQGYTAREAARQIGVSIAYLSRLLNRQRGLPADKTINRMEKALNIEQGVLFDAAGRHDPLAAKVFKHKNIRDLLRNLEPLSEDEFTRIVAEAERLAKKYHPNEE